MVLGEGSQLPERKGTSRRVTIVDIAQKAGVSRAAVSLALNGRPGLSAGTRERILSIAKDAGWYPSSAARALQGSRRECMRPNPRPPRRDPRLRAIFHGTDRWYRVRAIGRGLLHSPSSWWTSSRWTPSWNYIAGGEVSGVLTACSFSIYATRTRALMSLYGWVSRLLCWRAPRGQHPLPTVWQNEAAAVVGAVRYLAALGHRRIARIAGAAGFVQTRNRTEAYLRTVRELGLVATVVTTDFMAETGAHVTRQLLSERDPPTAFVYESDILAVAGLGVAHEMGLHVPRDISLVACDDSPFCQVVHPPISAITRDIPGLGAEACKRLLELIERGQCDDLELPYGHLTPRGSTGRARPI